MMLPLNVFEPRYLAMVEWLLARPQEDRFIGVPLMSPGDDASLAFQAKAPIHDVFGVGQLVDHRELPDGRRLIRLEGVGRARRLDELPLHEGFRRLVVEILDEKAPEDRHAFDVLRAQVERMSQVYPEGDRRLIEAVLQLRDERVVTYALASLVPNVEALEGLLASPHEGISAQARLQQRCLEIADCDGRVDVLLERLATLMDHLGGTRAAATSLN